MERMGQSINHSNCFTYAGGKGKPILEYEYMYVLFQNAKKKLCRLHSKLLTSACSSEGNLGTLFWLFLSTNC